MALTKEQLNRITKAFNTSVYNEFVKIKNGYDSSKEFEAFKAALNKKAIQYENDELYDDRQTKIMIQRAVEELAPIHIEKIEQKVADLAETKQALENNLHKENSTWHKVVEFEAKKLGDIDVTQLRTDSLLANSPKELVEAFKQYLNTTNENEALAKVLYRNAFIFLERMNQLGAEPKQLNELRVLVQQAKRQGMTEAETLSRDMLHELSKSNITGAAGTRLIHNYGKSMIDNHKNTLQHERSKKENPSEVSIAGNPDGYRDALI